MFQKNLPPNCTSLRFRAVRNVLYFLFAGHLSLAIILLVLVAKSIAITYLDKCYCPGKDPYLSRDKNLRNKMYALKSVFTSEKLDIWWRKGKS